MVKQTTRTTSLLDNREKAIQLIAELGIDDSTGSYIIKERLRRLNRTDVQVSSGASKFCLIFKKQGFVIKWCKDTDETDFNEAVAEVINYQKAIESNLAEFFPQTALLEEVKGIQFVIQEYVDCSEYDLPSETRKHLCKVVKTVPYKLVNKMEMAMYKSHKKSRRTLSYRWGASVISLYGKRKAKALCEFINENHINDLHDANVGYKNNLPIILDFSGYHRGN